MTRKNIAYLVFMLVVFIFPIIGSYVEENGITLSGTGIDRYVADITLDANGDMTVVETWDMVYRSELYVRFRDIDYDKYADGYPLFQSFANDASFVGDAASVRVLKDGVEIPVREGFSWEYDRDEQGFFVECYPERDSCESIFTEMDDPADALGEVTFEYTYRIEGAVTRYSDISELNWVLFEYAEGRIKSAAVTVHLPAGAAADDILVWGHSLAAGTITIVDGQTVEMALTNLGKDDYLEFRLLAPNALFPGIDAKNVVLHSEMNLATLTAYEAELAEETNRRITIARVVLIAAIVGVVAMGAVTYYVYIKYDKEYVASFQAEFLRDLPSDETPAEMSYLYYMKKINDEDVTATLLDLIRRKYVTIDYSGQNMLDADADFRLALVVGKSQEDLLPHERHLLHWFFDIVGDGKSVTTEKIENFGKSYDRAERFQEAARQFVRLAKQAGEKRGSFESALSGKNKAYSFALLPAGLLAASLLTAAAYALDNTLASIVSGVVLVAYLVYVGTIKKRSVAGNEAFVRWRAFRNFLVNFGNMKDYPMPGVIVWEHYLVYATSLKCADKVMDQLKVKLPMDEETLSGSTYMGVGMRSRGFYYGYMMGRFQRAYSTAGAAARQTIVAHNAARVSGGGHGGGFGGGRSFGGGGGGGRSR